MCEELLYRARFTSNSGKISDIFDSLHYRRLRRRHVRVEDEILYHLFFDQDTDIAMGLSADGVCPFKNRKSTCWPLLGVLYNLKPELRFLLEHVICFGVIPGLWYSLINRCYNIPNSYLVCYRSSRAKRPRLLSHSPPRRILATCSWCGDI
jgi:hypothetical protein